MAVHTMSIEQFQRLFAVLTSEQRESFLTKAMTYNGAKDKEVLHTFLTSISVYKNLENMKDEDVFKKLSELLIEDAASWWNQNKNQIKTFTEFEEKIKQEFLSKKPYQIFLELFTRQGVDESTEEYIKNKKDLFAQLPEPHTEDVQIDMLYGFLNIRIREKLNRESIETFDGLIMAATEIEQDPSFKRKRKRCAFCRMTGHIVEECKKRAKYAQECKDEDCTKTKIARHDVGTQMPHPSDPKYYCSGCNMPNMLRYKCPVCKLKPRPPRSKHSVLLKFSRIKLIKKTEERDSA